MPAKEKALSTTTHFLWYTPFIFNGRQYVHLSLTFIGIQYSSFGPQDQGGWLNATVADWFEEYARWLFQNSIFSTDLNADTLQRVNYCSVIKAWLFVCAEFALRNLETLWNSGSPWMNQRRRAYRWIIYHWWDVQWWQACRTREGAP